MLRELSVYISTKNKSFIPVVIFFLFVDWGPKKKYIFGRGAKVKKRGLRLRPKSPPSEWRLLADLYASVKGLSRFVKTRVTI